MNDCIMKTSSPISLSIKQEIHYIEDLNSEGNLTTNDSLATQSSISAWQTNSVKQEILDTESPGSPSIKQESICMVDIKIEPDQLINDDDSSTHFVIPGVSKSDTLLTTNCRNINKNKYKCEYCEYTAKGKKQLLRHSKSTHSVTVEIHKCRFCDYTSTKIAYLNTHVKLRHNPDANIYKCAECDYVTKDRSNLHRHFKIRHNKSYKPKSVVTSLMSEEKKTLSVSEEAEQCIERIANTTVSHRREIYKDKTEDVELNAVIENYEDTGKHKCEYCDYTTHWKYRLLQHIKSKHNVGTEVYKCTLCDYTSKWKTSLWKHVNTKHSATAEMYKCTFCSYTTTKMCFLNAHVKVKHNLNVHKCTFCDYTTTNTFCLNSHVKLRHNPNAQVYNCTLCDYSTKIKSDLNVHLKIRHNPNVEVHKCSFCGYTTHIMSYLNAHVRVRHNANAKVYTCPSCNYETKDKSNLYRHVRRKHKKPPSEHTISVTEGVSHNQEIYEDKADTDSNVPSITKHKDKHKCEYCEYTTERKSRLVEHIKSKHNVGGEIFKCAFCDFTCKWKGSLWKHVNVKHNPNAEVYSCTFCDYTTKINSYLHAHIDARHNPNAKILKCATCNYETKDKSNLYRHVRRGCNTYNQAVLEHGLSVSEEVKL